MRNWDEFYNACMKYLRENHNLKNIRTDCVIDGYKFGLVAQRVRMGTLNVTSDERATLNSLGFDWTVRKVLSFEEIYKQLVKFIEKFGHCDVWEKYITDDGINLGTIVRGIRCGQRKLTPKQKAKLDEIGFAWVSSNKRESIPEEDNKVEGAPEIQQLDSLEDQREQDTFAKKQNDIETRAEVHEKPDEKSQILKSNKISYVFDTSIASEIDTWNILFDEIIGQGDELVLTSIVLFELDNLQKRQPETMQSIGARKLLARVAEDDEHFGVVKIDAPNNILHDGSIIMFCMSKDNMALITADKVMALKARMEKIKTTYIKKSEKSDRYVETGHQNKDLAAKCSTNEESSVSGKGIQKVVKKDETQHSNDRIPGASFLNGQLSIEEFHTEELFIKVFSNVTEYSWGPMALAKNDEVYVISKTDSEKEVILEHYRVIDITPTRNAILINRRRVNLDSWYKLENINYRKFVANYCNIMKRA